MNPIPLAADDSLFQLVFLLVMLAGWGVKTAAEAHQRRKQQRERAERMPEPPDDDDEVVVRPMPRPVPRPATHAVGSRRLGATAERHLEELHPSLERRMGRRRGQAGARGPHHAHLHARRLLLGGAGLSMRDRVRAGILWSEVLGPPRALRGPHRPPTWERRIYPSISSTRPTPSSAMRPSTR